MVVRLQRIKDDGFKLKSFMTEMIVSHLADNGASMADYTGALEGVFAHVVKSRLKTRIYFTDYYPASKLPGPTGKAMEIFDPVNETNNVAAIYDDSHRQKIVNTAQDALEAISEARFATTRGRAIELSRKFSAHLSEGKNMTVSFTRTATFTIIHARYLASKVAADMHLCAAY